MKKKILSISIAAYNAQNDLVKCLDSLVNSSVVDDLEIIIINDGSKDNTLSIAKTYEENYSNSIIVVDKENGNHGSTLNASMRIASGKYYKVLDSDDCFNTKNLEKLVVFLKKHDIDLVINDRLIINISNNKKEYGSMIIDKSKIKYNSVYRFDEIADKVDLAMANMTIKTDILKKMNYKITEKSSYVDVEFIVYPIKDIQNIIFLNYYIYEYYIGQSNQSVNVKVMQKRENQHLNVIKNLLHYLNKEKLSNPKSILLENRIIDMLFVQYYLYLSMGNKTGLIKIKEYDDWLKENYRNLYNRVIEYGYKKSKNNTKLLVLLRKHKFKNYIILTKSINFIKSIRKVLIK